MATDAHSESRTAPNWKPMLVHAALIIAMVALMLSILNDPSGLPVPETATVYTVRVTWGGLVALLLVLGGAVALQDYLPRP